MRLKPDEIKKLAQHCGHKVLSDQKNVFKVPRAKIFEAIEAVLFHHFEEERRLEERADQLLKEKQDEFAGIQKSKAIFMIRNQLANEQDFILSGGSEQRMSPDKISHMAHLVADKLYDDDLMDFPNEDDGPKFFKEVLIRYFALEDQIDQRVRQKISSMSNPPMEHSKEWDILYRKYAEEEKRKIGHE